MATRPHSQQAVANNCSSDRRRDILGQAWGYALWTAWGAMSVYIKVILWFSEREYVYPAWGPLAYYTYVWGFFVYWGVAVVAYAVLRLAGVTF